MRHYYLFFVLIVTFFACQTDILPEPDTQKDCRLTRMVQGVHNGANYDTTFLFYYDAVGRMSNITMIIDSFPWEYTLTYDAQDRLVKVDNDDDFFPFEAVFTYNSQGLLEELHYYYVDTSKYVFVYDTSNLPVKAIDYRFKNGQWESNSEVRYTFQNGNMVKRDQYINGTYRWSDYYEYYDSIPNKSGNLTLIGFSSVLLGYYEEFLFFNKNMLKKIIDSYGVGNITYNIDSGNIVMSRNSYYSNQSKDTIQTDTRFFQFECR